MSCNEQTLKKDLTNLKVMELIVMDPCRSDCGYSWERESNRQRGKKESQMDRIKNNFV